RIAKGCLDILERDVAVAELFTVGLIGSPTTYQWSEMPNWRLFYSENRLEYPTLKVLPGFCNSHVGLENVTP
ncbi:hypothetical protein, partial [Hymenobacter crusticola]